MCSFTGATTRFGGATACYHPLQPCLVPKWFFAFRLDGQVSPRPVWVMSVMSVCVMSVWVMSVMSVCNECHECLSNESSASHMNHTWVCTVSYVAHTGMNCTVSHEWIVLLVTNELYCYLRSHSFLMWQVIRDFLFCMNIAIFFECSTPHIVLTIQRITHECVKKRRSFCGARLQIMTKVGLVYKSVYNHDKIKSERGALLVELVYKRDAQF